MSSHAFRFKQTCDEVGAAYNFPPREFRQIGVNDLITNGLTDHDGILEIVKKALVHF